MDSNWLRIYLEDLPFIASSYCRGFLLFKAMSVDLCKLLIFGFHALAMTVQSTA